MLQDILLQELFEKQQHKGITFVDVRSPEEFNEYTIPGSINIPVFNNEEREEVGTLYKQVSPEVAKERGIEIFSEKIPDFIAAFQEIEGEKAVYCWRGGMRSKTAATILDLAGQKVFRLQGGIRTYRKWVVENLDELKVGQKTIVLNGFTGTGKTEILHKLRENGYPVLDLEGYANHRGSIFGPIGLKPHNQKKFDALLLHDIQKHSELPFLIMEGESRRIGKAMIPETVMEKKEQGIQLFIKIPIEQRVQHILDEYQPWNHKDACLIAFLHIKKRIHTPVAEEIENNLLNGCYGSAIRLLLEHYYDPRYQHAGTHYKEQQKIMIEADSIEKAYIEVEKTIQSITAKQKMAN